MCARAPARISIMKGTQMNAIQRFCQEAEAYAAQFDCTVSELFTALDHAIEDGVIAAEPTPEILTMLIKAHIRSAREVSAQRI